MKKIIPIIFIITLIVSGCENSQLEQVANINLNKTFTVNQAGDFYERVKVYREDVVSTLDIPYDAKFKEFNYY
jgi:hypothetical protein